MRAAAGLAAALAFASPAVAQDRPAPPVEEAVEAAYGPPPPPQEMGPFPAGDPAGEAAALAPEALPDGSPVAADGAPPGDSSAANSAESQFQRLFGDPAGPSTPSGNGSQPDAPMLPGWLWGVVLLMVVALYFARKSLNLKRGDDEGIKVLSRASLGKDGNIAVLEVGDGQGGRRRLMVGYGSGAPRLVADLTPIPDFARMDFEPPAAPRAAPAAPRPAGAAPDAPSRAAAARSPDSEDPTSSRWVDALRVADGAAPRADRRPAAPGAQLERRGDLIAEVLAERSRRTVQVGEGFSLADIDGEGEDEGEEGEHPGVTYTARGTPG